jgi:membrane protease YdiL (CAAX protease family)
MKAFITDKPLLFAIGITVLGSLVEFLAFSAGGLAGLPEPALILIALLVSVAISLGFIHWLGWWKDAGFVATVENLPALTVPFLLIFIFFPFFGTVAIEPKVALFIAVIFFLTALSEEALSRGLLVRVFLPKGKWAAALIPAVLFGLARIVQVFQGMAWTANLLQITNAIIFGILYAAVRLRVNSIWPLIAIHMLWDIFSTTSGLYGPAAVHTLSDIPPLMWVLVWVPSIATAVYLTRKPATATIDGTPVG